MNSGSLLVAVDYTRHDLFVISSNVFIETVVRPLYPGALPSVLPLRLAKADRSVVFVGCLAHRPHQQGKQKLFLSHNLASDLGLHENDQVDCTPLLNIPRATKVFVSPLTVDDSEVVEQNALRIENQLLQNVQVVFPKMVITATIYAGAHAKVIVQKIEEGEGMEITQGCASMFEGTNFIVAVRPRQDSSEANKEVLQRPRWGFFRCSPMLESANLGSKGVHQTEGNASQWVISVHPNTAKSLYWMNQEHLKFSALDLQTLSTLEDAKLTPSFLRANMGKARVVLDESAPHDERVAIAHASFVDQTTTVLVIPEEAASGSAEKEDATAHPADVVPKESPETSPPCSALPLSEASLSIEKLSEVHGDVPCELLEHLRYTFERTQWTGGNVLLCGSKGCGKSTLVSCVLKVLPTVHTVVVECTAGKQLLPKLRAALVECVLCAPSVLVLDDFDTIAPEQKDGNVQAMTAVTKATLEAFLTTSSTLLSTAACKHVVIVATCTHRESINSCFRSAAFFEKFIVLNTLNRNTRRLMLKQLFQKVTDKDLGKMAALMDNYTPFDITQVSLRIKSKLDSVGSKEGDGSFLEHVEYAVSTFTPLAHTDIKFLKGEKLNWASIGGLSEAKKVLYDTLILPMRHPNLFARLPLKTRNGILLYGASGCGKTFIVEALVNAENINCIVVNGPEVFGKYIGQSEQKIRDVFERAQAAAPCVVFFDEFDSIAPQRGIDNSGVTDRVVNQLLCYLDGVEGRKDVYVVAASSRPDLIDAALLRPGRLDKAVFCAIPSHSDRFSILKNLFEKLSVTFDDTTLNHFAELTVNWTPADLAAMVSTANSFVSQRIIATLSANAAAADDELQESDGSNAFFIAHVGPNTSRDKVVDSIRRSIQGQRNLASHLNIKEVLSSKDVLEAIESTRPSLSERDILKQKRIHDIFSKKAPTPVVEAGTKLTYY
ncbi:unnamed protein product [Phytomonas sp. Hart1]|nr:unnamed protein product [Phytomonas sp. Hart1]|eukprot:CCW66449.1 unnamed protein product [Phytomonas sp. isolate Hart1]